MQDNDLTADELKTLQLFDAPDQPLDIDPQHFAKLLSLALLEQREGGSHLTEAGRERLRNTRN
ncbi:hypothetical protein [Devosia submarina]|uniref:hypothetical protein n=1 Tax=Devosia submarina TaxID=1173082 RepID=UPI000D349266|nr:hypothetical protein [Devosia submarina]